MYSEGVCSVCVCTDQLYYTQCKVCVCVSDDVCCIELIALLWELVLLSVYRLIVF